MLQAMEELFFQGIQAANTLNSRSLKIIIVIRQTFRIFSDGVARTGKKNTKKSPWASAFSHFLQLKAVAARSRLIVSPIVPLR
jgi:hypothetical protein